MTGISLFDTPLFSPYSGAEVHRLYDSTYSIRQTEYTDTQVTAVTWGDLKPYLTGGQYTATNGNATRLAIKTSLSNSAQVAGRFCMHRGQSLTDYGMNETAWGTGTYVVGMNATSLIWEQMQGGLGFSYITCTTTPEYTPEQLMMNLSYSQYVYQINILFILCVFLGFYVINLFKSKKYT